MITLFSPVSLSDTSPNFVVEEQVTVSAVGLQGADFITFERLMHNNPLPATVCGCRIIAPGELNIVGVQELLCDSCQTCGDQSPAVTPHVRLTARNPVVVLDHPQRVVLRAVYHGTGLGAGDVFVTATDSTTQDLTAGMRGCPPLICGQDFPEVWSGRVCDLRCDDVNETVEQKEVSNCGNERWTTDPASEAAGYAYWRATGNAFCTDGGVTGTGCPTNASSFTEGSGYYIEEQNPCGHSRWRLACAANSADYYTVTGNIRCGDTNVEEQVVNPCGVASWRVGPPVTWTPTGGTRCTETTFEQEERNNCGSTRWVFKQNLQWQPTGTYDCRDHVRYREERNQCGMLRWINLGEPCGDSVHTILSVTPAQASVPEGAQACWVVALDAPVIGDPLEIVFDLSGPDQARNNYPSPLVLYIPPGDTTGQLCVQTIDNPAVDGDENLCVQAHLSPRVHNAPGASCVLVLDNDENPYNVTGITQTTPDPVTEGQQVCWAVTVDRAVTDTPLVLEVEWGGADHARNNYLNSTVTIPVGAVTGNLCVQTTDDTDVDGTEQLCIAAFVANTRLGTVPPLPCVDILDNDTLPPGDSTHTVASIAPNTTPITEGQQACWTVTLDTPVANSALVMNFTLSGADQTRNNYSNPSVIVPVGASSVQVCVTTTDDVVVDGMEQLCIAAVTSARITGVPAASCINVDDNDVAGSTHAITCVTPPVDAVEGTNVCWTFELDTPVAGAPLTVAGTLSGSEQTVHHYPNPSVVLPIGATSGQLCVQTTDDTTVEGVKQLCLTFATSARVLSVNDTPCP